VAGPAGCPPSQQVCQLPHAARSQSPEGRSCKRSEGIAFAASHHRARRAACVCAARHAARYLQRREPRPKPRRGNQILYQRCSSYGGTRSIVFIRNQWITTDNNEPAGIDKNVNFSDNEEYELTSVG